MKLGFRCANCLAFEDEGHKVYYIKDDKDTIVPLCSEKCIEEYKLYLINKLKLKIQQIKTQEIQEDIW